MENIEVKVGVCWICPCFSKFKHSGMHESSEKFNCGMIEFQTDNDDFDKWYKLPSPRGAVYPKCPLRGKYLQITLKE